MKEKKIQISGLITRFFAQRRALLQRQAARIGLYYGQPPVLRYICDHQGCTQKDIAIDLGVSPASIAFSTKRMQKADLIQKQVNAENMRANKLSITGKGREVLENFNRQFEQGETALFDGFSDEELEQLETFLTRMNQNCENMIKKEAEQ